MGLINLALLDVFGLPSAHRIFIPFGVIGLYRWTLWCIKTLLSSFYVATKPMSEEAYREKFGADEGADNRYLTPQDVTIIVPTIDAGEEFVKAAQMWVKNGPFEVIIITLPHLVDGIERATFNIHPTMFTVISVPKANKRVQLCAGINTARTPIVALSDDDAIWTPDYLPWLLAPFNHDRKIGGAMSAQVMVPTLEKETIWEIIADMRLSLNSMEKKASTVADSGLACLTGRTAFYRTRILQDPEFQATFVNETWFGNRLTSGDDKYITRWLTKRYWNISYQYSADATLKTTFKPNMDFIKQVLRWTRNTWRSDMTCLFVDRVVWFRFPFVTFTMLDKLVNPIFLLYGPLAMGAVCYQTPGARAKGLVVASIVSWILLTRTLKLLVHFRRRPDHFWALPFYILFQYFFACLKIYALFTLNQTGWGSRASATSNNKVGSSDKKAPAAAAAGQQLQEVAARPDDRARAKEQEMTAVKLQGALEEGLSGRGRAENATPSITPVQSPMAAAAMRKAARRASATVAKPQEG